MKASRRWSLVVIGIFVVMLAALSTLTVFAHSGTDHRVIPSEASGGS